mgnify:FL=1|tara:strand:+ start:993 stop:1199 length:207 start_codon:yes stop_codon:yes gene_type:complete
MDERVVAFFKPGDLVKWYSTCADNIVVMDAGTGIIIKKTDNYSSNYTVYRNKKKDIINMNSYYLESLK